MSAAERIEFDAWRRADPAHERAYREMLDTWALTRAVPDHAAPAAAAGGA